MTDAETRILTNEELADIIEWEVLAAVADSDPKLHLVCSEAAARLREARPPETAP